MLSSSPKRFLRFSLLWGDKTNHLSYIKPKGFLPPHWKVCYVCVLCVRSLSLNIYIYKYKYIYIRYRFIANLWLCTLHIKRNTLNYFYIQYPGKFTFWTRRHGDLLQMMFRSQRLIFRDVKFNMYLHLAQKSNHMQVCIQINISNTIYIYINMCIPYTFILWVRWHSHPEHMTHYGEDFSVNLACWGRQSLERPSRTCELYEILFMYI